MRRSEIDSKSFIEAIFVVLGLPNLDIRQCPLALDKWIKLIVGPIQTFLGLTVNTSRMMVSIPRHYLDEVLDILNETWHPGRKQFTVQEAQILTGKVAHLAQAAPWAMGFSPLNSYVCLYCTRSEEQQGTVSRRFKEIQGFT